jgi:hypothetical protein
MFKTIKYLGHIHCSCHILGLTIKRIYFREKLQLPQHLTHIFLFNWKLVLYCTRLSMLIKTDNWSFMTALILNTAHSCCICPIWIKNKLHAALDHFHITMFHILQYISYKLVSTYFCIIYNGWHILSKGKLGNQQENAFSGQLFG